MFANVELTFLLEINVHHRSERSISSFTRKWTASRGYMFHNKTDVNCTPPAIDEFPSDGLSRTGRKSGWIAIHILIALYCFWFLAVICDDYFIPALEQICASTVLKTLFLCYNLQEYLTTLYRYAFAKGCGGCHNYGSSNFIPRAIYEYYRDICYER